MSTPTEYSRTSRARRRPTLRQLHNDEEGAAYTLSYVMVIPVYAILICMIIESVLMLTAKLGTVYSAFAAARTASVWSSATTWDKTMAKAKWAATKTMAPFASGTHGGLAQAASVDALAYDAAFKAYGKQAISDKFLLQKYGYAKQHLKVDIAGPPTSWNAPIIAKVTYEFPFNIPGIGRMFGRRGIDGRFYFVITSTAEMPNEAPQDDRKTIGIGYGTLE
ncbi:MAG: hypothetical protein U0805_21025 [Pirellulales bacterium]